MRASRAGIVACAAVGAALSLSACGGGSSSADVTAADTGKPTAARDRSRDDGCVGGLVRFVRSLDGLRDQLAVGLTYDRYLENVERLRRAYRAIPVKKASVECVLGVGVAAEQALNQHIEATNTWGNCLAESCDLSSVEPEIKLKWERASVFISHAQDGLRRVRSP
jgi:hypothetical protein